MEKGTKHTEEAKKKIGEAHKGKKRPPRSEEWRKKQSLVHKGQKGFWKGVKRPPFSDEWRKNMSRVKQGDKTHLWRGGITEENKIIRSGIEFRLWREAVFARDNWACQECGDRCGNGKAVELHPHHIKPFAKFPDVRFAIDNGVTLCVGCHKKEHQHTFGVER